MANAIDYLCWRGDISFSASPVNEVDMFIFSQLSTPDFCSIIDDAIENTNLSDIIRAYMKNRTLKDSLGPLQSKYIMRFLKQTSDTQRFGSVIVPHTENHVDFATEEQFAAITFLIPDGTVCVAFRGTDDTIIGWKEDCMLAVRENVPAQVDAVRYLKETAQKYKGNIRICGHSKGGNLAISSAVLVPKKVRDRITEVYNFDGPGFSEKFIQKPEYQEMKDRIITVLSQNSLVGTLLEQVGSIRFVKSSVSGPVAHDGFKWLVLGPSFESSTGLSASSNVFDKALKDALSHMGIQERKKFTDDLFDVLLSTGARTVTDLTRLKIPEVTKMITSLGANPAVSLFVRKVSKSFAREIVMENRKKKTGLTAG